MSSIVRVVLFILLFATIAYANWGATKYGGQQWGSGKWGTSSAAPAQAGFLLLESSGDKLLLESGVTDALLLEG